MKPIAQEALMGCAIACVASLAGISYKKMRGYFYNGKTKERISGFYNRDIISSLSKIGVSAKAYSIKRWGNKRIRVGTIVFIERLEKHPAGHYLLKTKRGWMNPWINYPDINPAKAGFQKRLPSRARWVIDIVKLRVG